MSTIGTDGKGKKRAAVVEPEKIESPKPATKEKRKEKKGKDSVIAEPAKEQAAAAPQVKIDTKKVKKQKKQRENSDKAAEEEAARGDSEGAGEGDGEGQEQGGDDLKNQKWSKKRQRFEARKEKLTFLDKEVSRERIKKIVSPELENYVCWRCSENSLSKNKYEFQTTQGTKIVCNGCNGNLLALCPKPAKTASA